MLNFRYRARKYFAYRKIMYNFGVGFVWVRPQNFVKYW